VSLAGVVVSMVGGVVVLARKLTRWSEVSAGVAPLLLMLLACLFLQNMLSAMTWVYVNRLEARADKEANRLLLEGNPAVMWALQRTQRLAEALDRFAVFLPIVGYAGTALTGIVSLFYFVFKLLRWEQLFIGLAPALLIVGLIVFLQFAVGGVLILNIRRSTWLLDVEGQPLVTVERRENFD
jgi:hypothetical protein